MEIDQPILRKAIAADLEFYFRLKNDPSVRESGFNSEAISLETHTQWFLKKIKDPNAYLFVVVCDGKPAGQMRIDIDGANAETDIAVSPDFRGRGLAVFAIKKSCARVFTERPELATIFAHIKKDNIGSQKSFLKAGFADNGIVNYGGNECVEMTLRRE